MDVMPAPSDVESLLVSLVPSYGEDNPKTKYLSFRASGFNVREAGALIGVHQRTVMRWRQDDAGFAELDTKRIGELRQKVGAQFGYAEFLRNFRLVMIRDGKLLKKQALVPENLSGEEKAELSKIRQYYTPRELEIVRGALAGGKPGEASGGQVNFTQIVMNMARERAREEPHRNGQVVSYDAEE